MKRMMKRKVFLMGMAFAAGFPVGSHAKDNDRAERKHVSPAARDEIQEAPEMRVDREDGGQSALFEKLKGLVANLNARTETSIDSEAVSSWKLELMRHEPSRLGLTDNPRTDTGKAVGLALRLNF